VTQKWLNDNKEKALGLTHAFVVLTENKNFDVKDEKHTFDLRCHLALHGSAEKTETVRPAFDYSKKTGLLAFLKEENVPIVKNIKAQ